MTAESRSTIEPPTGWLTLQQSADLIGRARWVELRLFESLGRWVTESPDSLAKMVLAKHSHHHAWRGAMWAERLPHLGELTPDALTVAPAAAVESMFDRLDGFVALGEVPRSATAQRLATVYRVVLPRLAAEYARHRQWCSPVADGAVIRTIDLLMFDLDRDLIEGEEVLASLLAGSTSEAAVGPADDTPKAENSAESAVRAESSLVDQMVAEPADDPVELVAKLVADLGAEIDAAGGIVGGVR